MSSISVDRKTVPVERRAALRHVLALGVNFLLSGRTEGSGQVLDMSESGLALMSDSPAKQGEEVILYPEGLGRICGKVSRIFRGGFAVEFLLSPDQAESMKTRISAAIKGVPYLRLAEKRSAIRLRYDIETQMRVSDNADWVDCRIIDMSRSGCRVACELVPEVGVRVMIGALTGIVKRHVRGGFAVGFISASRDRPRAVATSPLTGDAGRNPIA